MLQGKNQGVAADKNKLDYNIENLYERKILNPEKIIYLTESEIRMIGIDDEDGLFESKESFNELNIVLEI